MIEDDNATEVPDDAADTRRGISGQAAFPRFAHPEHGELIVVGSDGRSKLCRRPTDGTEYRIGTRVVNRLRFAARRTEPLFADPLDTPEARAESLTDVVTTALSALPDGPVRTRIARDIWAAANAFLAT